MDPRRGPYKSSGYPAPRIQRSNSSSTSSLGHSIRDRSLTVQSPCPPWCRVRWNVSPLRPHTSGSLRTTTSKAEPSLATLRLSSGQVIAMAAPMGGEGELPAVPWGELPEAGGLQDSAHQQCIPSRVAWYLSRGQAKGGALPALVPLHRSGGHHLPLAVHRQLPGLGCWERSLGGCAADQPALPFCVDARDSLHNAAHGEVQCAAAHEQQQTMNDAHDASNHISSGDLTATNINLD